MSSESSNIDGISKQSQEEKISVDNAAGSGSEESKVINPGDSSIDATDFLKGMRRKARENQLGPQDVSNERDLEYMIKLIQGIITINEEIWRRCEDQMAPSRPPGFQIEKAEQRNARMMRLSYDEALVDASDKCVDITVKKSLHYKDFGPAPSIPSSLTKKVAQIPPQENDRQILLDYREYMQRVALLEDEVLVSFLKKLQTHLEKVQCYVGEIEKWLDEAHSIIHFLNEVFDKELKIGNLDDNWKVRCDSATATCFNCFYPTSTHVYSESHCHFLCSKNCRKLSASSRIPKYYSQPAPDVLFKAHMSPGSTGLTFDLHAEDGKAKLKSFHTFVERFKDEEKGAEKEGEVVDVDVDVNVDEDEEEVGDEGEDGDESEDEDVYDIWDDVDDENEDEDENEVFEDEYDNNDY